MFAIPVTQPTGLPEVLTYLFEFKFLLPSKQEIWFPSLWIHSFTLTISRQNVLPLLYVNRLILLNTDFIFQYNEYYNIAFSFFNIISFFFQKLMSPEFYSSTVILFYILSMLLEACQLQSYQLNNLLPLIQHFWLFSKFLFHYQLLI